MLAGWDRWGLVELYLGVGGGTRGGYYLKVFGVFLSFVLSHSQPLYLGD